MGKFYDCETDHLSSKVSKVAKDFEAVLFKVKSSPTNRKKLFKLFKTGNASLSCEESLFRQCWNMECALVIASVISIENRFNCRERLSGLVLYIWIHAGYYNNVTSTFPCQNGKHVFEFVFDFSFEDLLECRCVAD